MVALDAETINGILDLIEQPPEDDSYDKLKSRLVQSFKLSTVDKIKRALEFPPLADESPIRLADNIMALTLDATGEDFAKAVFMLKLPDGVRRTMWLEPLTLWTEMKARANGLWHAEKTKSRASLYKAAVASEPETNAVRTAPRGRKNSKFQEFARTFNQRPNGPCVFHEFFGRSATKCREPCDRAGNVRAGRQ